REPPSDVVPYSSPSQVCTTPPRGADPSAAGENACSMVKAPAVESLNTVPPSFAPPKAAVPYKNPSLASCNPAIGLLPSQPVNEWSTVTGPPEVGIEKAVPSSVAPPVSVVP